MNFLNYDKYVKSQDAEWIVFIHGAGGSIQTWKPQIKTLKKHYNLLLIDLRDHGKSKNVTPEADSYSFDLIVGDIVTILTHEEIEYAHFVTLSFGSVLMQALYKQHPEMVNRMVLIGGIFNANWMIKGFVHLARLFNLFLSYPSMYRTFSWLLMPKKRNQLARRVYQMQARKLSQDEYLKWLGIYSEFFLLLRSFHSQKIKRKMLILMGEDDYLFLPSAEKFSASQTGAELRRIEKAGHICNIDKPDDVNEAIIDFLSTDTIQSKRQQTIELFGTS